MANMDHISEDMSPGSDHSRDQTVQEMFDNREFHDMEDSLSFSSQQAQEQEQERQHQQHQHQIYHQHHQHHPYMHMQHRKQSQPHMYPGHPTWHTARPHPHFVTAYGNPFFAQQHHPTLMLAHAHKHVTETKARFAKHEVEVLEAEFQKNHKPNSIIKRGLAEKMGVEVPRINNWFQNRRAREKHDIKLREYEKQQGEEQKRDTSESSSPASRSANDRRQGDGGSESENVDQYEHQPTISTAVMGGDEGELEETALSHDQAHSNSCDEVSDEVSSNSSPVLEQDPGFTPASDLDDFDFGPSFSSGVAGGDFQGHSHFGNQEDEVQNNMFLTPFSDDSSCHGLPSAPYIHFHVPTFPSESFLEATTPMPMNNNEQFAGGYPFKPREMPTMSVSQSPPPPPTELCFKPQRSIAERRKRQRPAELSDFARSSRSQGPKTGIEMGRRLEHPAPMRRTASATGMYPLGISKSSTGSSYNVKQESLLIGLRTSGSPTLTTLNTAISPLSPRDRELTPATMSSSDDHHDHSFGSFDAHYPVKADPYAIHTPPKTPGLQLNLQPHTFNMSADAFGHGLDESLMTPGLVRDGSELDFPGSNASGYHSVPRYAASQPVTPGFPPHNFGPSYMWGPQPSNNAAEYRFPDSSSCYMESSARSSPGARHLATPVNFQFAQNVTPQDFKVEM